jgi:hypothetical protein
LSRVRRKRTFAIGVRADRIIVASAALRAATLVTRGNRIRSYVQQTGLVKMAFC